MPKRLTDLRGKCGSCLWYEPLIKNGKKTARGSCTKGRRPVYIIQEAVEALEAFDAQCKEDKS